MSRMKIGIGLPNTVPGATGAGLLEWATRAEACGFAFVSTVDRLAYPSYDVLTTLAAVAGATTRIGLVTNALLAPSYPDLRLAKATVTLADLSQGRLTLGLGIGTREADYPEPGQPFTARGRALDRQLELLHRAWRGEGVADGAPVAPAVPGQRVPLLIGGYGEHAIRRTVQWGAGWTGAGGGLARSAPMIESVRQRWPAAGREGAPRLLGLSYFSIGQEAESDAYLRAYYGYDPALAAMVAAGAVREAQAIRDVPGAYEAAGFTELTFTPTLADPGQVDRLAGLVL
jgi:alkanesulfonate monooxygenase SsuD/methylene tetrahydromethanopterin reductase-like flavin-dependent oxidoreductase (luciferase family)